MGKEKIYTLAPARRAGRIDKVLAELLPELSRSYIQTLRGKGASYTMVRLRSQMRK